MHISIVVPVFNEAKTLPDFLEATHSLAAELVFVDGGSNDETRHLLTSSGCTWLQAPQGRAIQMNAGAAAASGDVFLFLHADTLLPAGALERIDEAVTGGATGGYFDVRLDSTRPALRIVGHLITWRSRVTGVATGDQAIFVTRPVFEKLGGYATLPLFEDIDLSRRLKRSGHVARLSPPVVTSPRRWERLGVAHTVLRMWALRTLYYCGVSPDRLARHYEAAR